MGGLERLVLRVKGARDLAHWYGRVLGMKVETEYGEITAHYPGPGVVLVFVDVREGEAEYDVSDRSSVYWKIGLCMSDLDLARDRIQQHGVIVTQPRQFLQVGYVAHLKDPRGFSIELIQTTFNQLKPEDRPQPKEGLALGQETVIGMVTSRCKDIQATLAVYQASLGMKLLSVQDVQQYGFCLYFFAFTEEEPPGPVDSVQIRPWLWQRPYTVLEVQARHGAALHPLARVGEGVEHLEVRGSSPQVWKKLQSVGVSVEGEEGVFTDTDGFRVKLIH